MLMDYKVYHPDYGEGVVKRIYGYRIDLEFSDKAMSMVFPGAFSTGLTTHDADLLRIVEETSNTVTRQVHKSDEISSKTDVLKIINNFTFDFVSNRVKSLPFASNEELFEAIGYLAKPGVIHGIWAEIPASVASAFKQYFSDENIMPITEGTTGKGMSNKFGIQCRLNLANVDNCPNIIRNKLAKGLGKQIVNRLNCTLFVLQLIKFFGFHFGNEKQNISAIRKIATDFGYLNEFNKGFNR